MGANAQTRGAERRLTQDQRRERSERRMIAAAIELFARQGSGRTTLMEIGRLSGYTHGLVSHRFGSKNGLVRELLRRLQRDFARRQLAEATGKRKSLEALLEVVRGALEVIGQGKSSARAIRALTVLMAEALGPVPEILGDAVDLDRNFRAVVRRLIQQGIEAGEIRKDVRAAEQAAVIVGMVRGITIQWFLDPRSLALESVIDEVTGNIRRSLERRN